MTTLEVLMKAEKSLLDEDIEFDFQSFDDCTCGHILRAVEGKRGYAGNVTVDQHSEYAKVIQEIAVALGYTGDDDFMGDDIGSAIRYVSDHTAKQAGGRVITRQHALKTIRTAMLALQPEEVSMEYATA